MMMMMMMIIMMTIMMIITNDQNIPGMRVWTSWLNRTIQTAAGIQAGLNSLQILGRNWV